MQPDLLEALTGACFVPTGGADRGAPWLRRRTCRAAERAVPSSAPAPSGRGAAGEVGRGSGGRGEHLLERPRRGYVGVSVHTVLFPAIWTVIRRGHALPRTHLQGYPLGRCGVRTRGVSPTGLADPDRGRDGGADGGLHA